MAAYDLDTLKVRFDRSPFTRWLDLKPVAISDTDVESEISTRAEMQGSPVRDVLHGGILATLIDIACSFSLIVGDGKDYVTVDLRTDFHRGSKGGTLSVKGTVVRKGRQLSTTQAHITDVSGKLIASGRGVFMAVQSSDAVREAAESAL